VARDAATRGDREFMSASREYNGGCHCGKVRYRVDLDLSKELVICNCSICKRMGSILAFAPASQFTLERGEEVLTDYLFNKKVIHHLFCSNCGIRSFARGQMPDGKAMCAVNVRCLDDVDPGNLKTKQVDGASA
jgi:hypothetical protein